MAKEITGTVVSTKMQKTIVVSVERKLRHPVYKKVITRHQKMKAHNEMEGIQEGDVVTIAETRPISKEKHFIVIRKEESKS
jgi:small subunit ribosomal protein S17